MVNNVQKVFVTIVVIHYRIVDGPVSSLTICRSAPATVCWGYWPLGGASSGALWARPCGQLSVVLGACWGRTSRIRGVLGSYVVH